ncbi:hypothetical protein SKAU_G00299110 [Synaphobranchus kaupii]|uniref:Ran-GTPase activating protein 1 C-terminal domain-containing protein n=1 Tax=Synaphobranchus kaupii TaxID=118154 RepID=A0A9Q1IN35_SYNKA|nr:hypothetical protein SKAU_G00299110 [Synaphobranchus kaupii]
MSGNGKSWGIRLRWRVAPFRRSLVRLQALAFSTGVHPSPVNQASSLLPANDVSSFLCFPSPDKLLNLGAKRTLLIEQQVDMADAGKTAEAFLKISSVYKEEAEVKRAVLESIDAVLRKAFSHPSFQAYSFISALLVLLGLIKSEEKVKPVCVVPGHLLALDHAVRQDYFPREHIAVLNAFMSRTSQALESCTSAKSSLKSTLDQLGNEC